MPNYKEFAAKIKAKYPEHNDIDDLVLAKAWVEKYPVYADRVQFQSFGERLMESAGEAIAAPVVPLAAAVGVPGAKEALGRALDKRPGQFGVTRPLQMLGEEVVEPAKEAAIANIRGDIGSLEEGIATLPGLRRAPAVAGPLAATAMAPARALTGAADIFATGLTPQGMAEQAGGQVLGPVVGKGMMKAAQALKPAAQPLVRWWAKRFLPKANRGATMAVIEKFPEVTTPGYFEQNLEPVVAETTQAMAKATEGATKASTALIEKYGNRPVSTIRNLREAFMSKLRNLPPSSLQDKKFTKSIDTITKKISDIDNTLAERPPRIKTFSGMKREFTVKGKPGDFRDPKSVFNLGTTDVPKKAPLSEVMQLKNTVKAEIDNLSGQADTADLTRALIDYRKRLDSIIENTPGKSGDLAREARKLWADKFQAKKEIGRLIGDNPDIDPTDATTKAKIVAKLRQAFTAGDETLLKELEKLSPGLGTKIQKLAASSHGSFDDWGNIIPSLGFGSAGYILNNVFKGPIPAATFGVLGAYGLATSPRVAGSAVRGAFGPSRTINKAAATAAKATRRAMPMFPGLIRETDE